VDLFGDADPWRVLTGSVLMALLLAVVATWPVCVLLLHAYRRSITRGMRRSGTTAAPLSSLVPEPRQHGPRIQVLPVTDAGPVALLGRAQGRARRVQVLFAVVGLLYGFGVTVSLTVIHDLPWLPVRTVLLTLMYAWPTVPTVLALSSVTRRGRRVVWGAYLAALVALMAVGRLSLVEIVILPLLLVGMPALFVLATGARAVRGAAWFVVPALMLTVMPLLLLLGILVPYLRYGEGTLRYGWSFLLASLAIGVGAVAVSVAYGWCFRRAYRRKWASDQTLLLLQWWFIAAVFVTLDLATQGTSAALRGFACFLVFLLVLLAAAAVARRPSDPPVRLLLLRTFGSRGRSTRLFRDLTKQWRWIGSVELIIAPDLASETLEPDEFLDFIYGRLPQRFVREEESLQERLRTLDLAPDRDGRYRINELLCHDDMWRPAVEALATETDAVLIDLRGFSPGHAGVAYELERLVALVPLSRVVAVVDASTDRETLRLALDRAAALAPASSPLRSDPAPALRTVELQAGDADASPRLLAAVARAASVGPAGPEGVSSQLFGRRARGGSRGSPPLEGSRRAEHVGAERHGEHGRHQQPVGDEHADAVAGHQPEQPGDGGVGHQEADEGRHRGR
jgi:hypothetical protein